MSVIPTEWGEPDSRIGVYFEVFVMGLLVVILGAIVYREPFTIAISITPRRLAGATILGCVLGIAMTYLTILNERFRRLWADSHIFRFSGLFMLIMGSQLALNIAPARTLLTMIATALTFIPLRVAIYRRAR